MLIVFDCGLVEELFEEVMLFCVGVVIVVSMGGFDEL